MIEISLIEALEIINRKDLKAFAVPFDISYRTLNRQTKKGGKLIELKKARLLRAKPSDFTPTDLQKLNFVPGNKANQDHWKNRTRNLELLDGKIKKMHIHLIDTINGKKVIY